MNCVRCGLDLAEGDKVCPRCGTARGLIRQDFEKLKQETDSLLNVFRAGGLTEEAYRSRIQALMLSDPAGVHWKYDPETDGWSCYRNGRWESTFPPLLQENPPLPFPTPPQPNITSQIFVSDSPQTPPRDHKTKWILPGVLAVMLLILGYITFAWFMSGYQESRLQGEILDAGQSGEDLWTMALTDAQIAMRDYRGTPEAFTILFYQEEQEDGSILDVRLETWTYYSTDTEVTFFNGEQISEETLLDHLENVTPTTYLPEQFPYRLSAQEVAQAAGVAEYLQVPLDNKFVENGQVYYADGLTWGVTGDHLTFVQALAFGGR